MIRLGFLVLLVLCICSCQSLKLGQKAKTEEVNPYELVDNAGYSPGGFYGDASGGGGYPSEGQTFGANGTGGAGSGGSLEHPQIAPFSEEAGEHSTAVPAGSPEPKPAVARRPPSARPSSGPAAKKTATSVASTATRKSPATASSGKRTGSRTTAGTKQGTIVKAVYHPTSTASGGKKKATVRRVHTVKPGDTLWELAERYEVSIAAVKQQNHLTSDLIRVGQRLTID
jgi:LysM repeat protein